ncbi:hypothetical protein CKO20_11060 [Rhodocyclus tenuis]|nr:hypothetical protein [Rhodocyclus tenuis]
MEAIVHALLELPATLDDESVAGSMRSLFPDLRFTSCADDDIPARSKPVAEVGKAAASEAPLFRLYLIDASEHCLRLTNDPELACGIVLARCDED